MTKIKANPANARWLLVTALAQCGYKVWIEEVETKLFPPKTETKFFVCYEELKGGAE